MVVAEMSPGKALQVKEGTTPGSLSPQPPLTQWSQHHLSS